MYIQMEDSEIEVAGRHVNIYNAMTFGAAQKATWLENATPQFISPLPNTLDLSQVRLIQSWCLAASTRGDRHRHTDTLTHKHIDTQTDRHTDTDIDTDTHIGL